jgi:hypothetical protein
MTETVGSSTSTNRSGSVWEIYFPKRAAGHRASIFIASFPEILYLWPTIVVLYLCAFFQGVAGLSPVGLGWLAVIVFCMNLLILVQDFDQKKFLILCLGILAIILGTWIVNLYGFTFLKSIAGWITSFQPAFSTDAYIVMAVILTLMFVWGVVTPLFSYWKLEQNEFIHYSQPVGKDMSIARTGCTIYKEVPDIFECLLGFGGGTLIIRRENQILATIPHIPFLGLRMPAIEHLLSETRVIVDKD